jgi:hypothetical protein
MRIKFVNVDGQQAMYVDRRLVYQGPPLDGFQAVQRLRRCQIENPKTDLNILSADIHGLTDSGIGVLGIIGNFPRELEVIERFLVG